MSVVHLGLAAGKQFLFTCVHYLCAKSVTGFLLSEPLEKKPLWGVRFSLPISKNLVLLCPHVNNDASSDVGDFPLAIGNIRYTSKLVL